MLFSDRKLSWIPVDYTGTFITIDEAIFQLIFLQSAFFQQLSPILNRAYGLFSRPTFAVFGLNRFLNRIVKDFSQNNVEYDFSFFYQNDKHLEQFGTGVLTIEEHQLIGMNLRLFMQEVIVVSAAVKERYGDDTVIFNTLKRLYIHLILLRNVLIDKLRVYLNKSNLQVYWDNIYYGCEMKHIPESLAHQQSLAVALSLEVDLKYYYDHLSDASCLCDFPI